MPRLMSLIFLVATILVIGALSFQVMAEFLLPMFLAVILGIVFEPLHKYLLVKTRGREHVAALLTTAAILLAVLLPLCGLLFLAIQEGVAIAGRIDPQALFEHIEAMLAPLRPYAERLSIPIPDSFDEVVELLNTNLQGYFRPALVQALARIGRLLFGLAIMIISLYFFLLDGPVMIAAVMRLSPLDDRYEMRLLEEFSQVSRAVVVATLLSAFVQGLLASPAYWLLGFPTVFLLTALTMVLAIIPFVGAAGVWVPCCIWLLVFEGRILPAVVLFAYGTLVISLADNVIKPLVLAGRSNLHPLLALLSVLGGIEALGPIGILVGPMVLSFLHALLLMLRDEIGHYQRLSKQSAT